MTSIPAALAAQQAILQQNVALSVIKQNAQADQAFANVIKETIENTPQPGGRGSNVNIRV
ncbi:MAG: hypothetical protein KDJ35_07160 [Alphaproteobacteria bacterium]|nr:hypothetical protein [Alphaproteobacteria bacterium]